MENNKLPSNKEPRAPGIISRLVDTFVGIGLGESFLRTGTTILSITLLIVVVWLLRIFYLQGPETAKASASAPEAVSTVLAPGERTLQQVSLDIFNGIPRLAQVHT